jgi:hypothetical protein
MIPKYEVRRKGEKEWYEVGHIYYDKKVISYYNGIDRELPPNPYVEYINFKDAELREVKDERD